MRPSSEAVYSALTRFKELGPDEIDWLIATGKTIELADGQVLVTAGERIDRLYIALSGTTRITVASTAGEQEIAQGKPGDITGIVSFLTAQPANTTITSLSPSQVLSISHHQLQTQLKQNQKFAAHFYQAIAIVLSEQIRQISALLVRSQATVPQPLRKVLLVFAELWDKDIDWLVASSIPKTAVPQIPLIQAGEPTDALYILLEGSLSVSISLTIDGQVLQKEVAKLAAGEIVGEMSFVDALPPSATVTAAETSLVLAIPRTTLFAQLQQDLGFAARFYRAIAVILADRLQDRLAQHGYSKLTYLQDQPLSEEEEYEDELDVDLLDHVALAGARFDWMVRQVRAKR